MFVKVKFHGILKKICPDEYNVDANTPAEAIRGITNQFKDKLFRKDGRRFICSVKECPNQINLTSGIRTEELNIYPSFCASGGGNGSWVMVVVGALLIAAAVFMGPAGFALASYGTGFFSAATATTMLAVGTSLMLSGLSSMLFTSKVDTSLGSTDNGDSSKTFGNNGNTTKIGTRIPVGYGKYKIAGQYLSINTQTVDRGVK